MNDSAIPFNKPFLTGKEMHYIYQAVYSGKISGNGIFTQKCQKFFEDKYGFKKTLLTTSCTDALEMCAILADIKPGDEVIVPAYTFVSTALAFARQGAKVVYADSSADNPNIDVNQIDKLITSRTKAIVPVHYAGIACDMDAIMGIAAKHNLLVIEDAAQAIDSYYKGKPLGSIGHMAAFSFHETKNINSGEGGMLTINDIHFLKRAEIIWEKGTNRAEFFRGEINKYNWIDTGSSFLPSEIIAAYLYAQLENIDNIQNQRKYIWSKYYSSLNDYCRENDISCPYIPEFATSNGHMFYLTCSSFDQRKRLIEHLKSFNVQAVTHYLSLHKSPYNNGNKENYEMPNSDKYTDRLLRLPLYYELSEEDLNRIMKAIISF